MYLKRNSNQDRVYTMRALGRRQWVVTNLDVEIDSSFFWEEYWQQHPNHEQACSDDQSRRIADATIDCRRISVRILK
jgi:hypothetical protein